MEDLKIAKSESFDDVIKRLMVQLMEMFAEKEEIELNEETLKELKKRINNVHMGKVLSTKEFKARLYGTS